MECLCAGFSIQRVAVAQQHGTSTTCLVFGLLSCPVHCQCQEMFTFYIPLLLDLNWSMNIRPESAVLQPEQVELTDPGLNSFSGNRSIHF